MNLRRYSTVLRNAVPEDAAAWDEYAAAPPFVVMKLTPRVKEQWPTPFPRAEVRPHFWSDDHIDYHCKVK